MKRFEFLRFISAAVASAFAACQAHAVTIPTVPIGNPGNPADVRYVEDVHPNGVGSVAYPFRIGTTEITNAQYVEFLNAVAASDVHLLYSINRSSSTWHGIVRGGSAGNYSYAVKAPAVGQGPGGSDYTYGDKPVGFLSWYQVIRFANWLHNGQPTGAQDPSTTEDGAYTISGFTVGPRNANARWWLPSEDEWYKAAYYDPGAGVYYDYPTRTNSVPNNNLPASDTGNSANFWDGSHTTGNFDYPMTNPGAYTLSASPVGTFDQGGNVWEWTETVAFEFARIIRGGSFGDGSERLHANSFVSTGPGTQDDVYIGFRLATIIPEPSTLLLGAMASVGLLLRRRALFPHLSPRAIYSALYLSKRRLMKATTSFALLLVMLLSTSAHAATLSVSSVAELIAAINTANQNSETDTIALAAGATFTLSEINNTTTNGSTGLPAIAANENLTIFGNGATIERSTEVGTPSFRLLDVTSGASLALENLTLQGGLAYSSGVSALGGAIFNQGTLTLTGVTVRNNTARGFEGRRGERPVGNGDAAAGGGIYSSGALLAADSTIQNNQAVGGPGRPFGGAVLQPSGPGGAGLGGGIYIDSGTATLTGLTLRSNTAQGGLGGDGFGIGRSAQGGNGGDGLGGGMYVASGTVAVHHSHVTSNNAQRGERGPGNPRGEFGLGKGGGMFILNGSVGLDDFTIDHVTSNTASTSHSNIYGTFQLLPDPLPGDFNHDGAVDAADYVVWRKTDDTQEGYNLWRANFVVSLGPGSGSVLPSAEPLSAAVPEPTALALIAFGLLGMIVRVRRPLPTIE